MLTCRTRSSSSAPCTVRSRLHNLDPGSLQISCVLWKTEDLAYVSCPHYHRRYRAPSAVLMLSILCRCNGEAAATGHAGAHHLPGCQGPGPQRLLCSCHRQRCSRQQRSSTLRGGAVQSSQEASRCLIIFTRGLAGAAHLHAKALRFEESLGMCMDPWLLGLDTWKAFLASCVRRMYVVFSSL